jgi:hypothetical protein
VLVAPARHLRPRPKVLDNLRGNVSNHRKTLASCRAKDAAFPPAHHVLGRFQPCPNVEQTENEVNAISVEIDT